MSFYYFPMHFLSSMNSLAEPFENTYDVSRLIAAEFTALLYTAFTRSIESAPTMPPILILF